MSTLWDCGPGTTGVTFGFLSMRALFCPHLDTSKTPTEKKVQEPNRAKFEPESRPISFLVISCVIFREKRKKNTTKKVILKDYSGSVFHPWSIMDCMTWAAHSSRVSHRGAAAKRSHITAEFREVLSASNRHCLKTLKHRSAQLQQWKMSLPLLKQAKWLHIF